MKKKILWSKIINTLFISLALVFIGGIMGGIIITGGGIFVYCGLFIFISCSIIAFTNIKEKAPYEE